MANPSIEYLTQERTAELEPWLLPLLQVSCDGNEISRLDLSPEDIMRSIYDREAVAFLYSEDGDPMCVLVIDFYTEGSVRCANIIALSGKKLTSFKRHYWQLILDYLREEGVTHLDAYVDSSRAKLYLGKFGFNRSCAFLRMDLRGN